VAAASTDKKCHFRGTDVETSLTVVRLPRPLRSGCPALLAAALWCNRRQNLVLGHDRRRKSPRSAKSATGSRLKARLTALSPQHVCDLRTLVLRRSSGRYAADCSSRAPLRPTVTALNCPISRPTPFTTPNSRFVTQSGCYSHSEHPGPFGTSPPHARARSAPLAPVRNRMKILHVSRGVHYFCELDAGELGRTFDNVSNTVCDTVQCTVGQGRP
jgi:hypothetical protein